MTTNDTSKAIAAKNLKKPEKSINYSTMKEAIALGKTDRDLFLDFNNCSILPEAGILTSGIYYDMIQHYWMLADSNRMLHYKKGIFDKNCLKGKVVLDAGSGFGILALWCAQAGAKKVYAVEITDNYKHIVEAAEVNGLSDVIEVIHGDALVVDLPEKVDIIISEPIGNAIISEGMFHFICNVRDKFLKEDGKIFPCGGNLYISAVTDYDFYGKMESFFKNFKAAYGVKMNHLLPRIRDSLSNRAFQKVVRKEFLRSQPVLFKTLDFKKMTHDEASCVAGEFELEIVGDGDIHGLNVWFDIHFPNGTILDTSPLSQPTHWKSLVCYFKEPKNVTEGQKIKGSVSCSIIEDYAFCLDVVMEYQIDDGPLEQHSYVQGFDRGQLLNTPNYGIDPN